MRGRRDSASANSLGSTRCDTVIVSFRARMRGISVTASSRDQRRDSSFLGMTRFPCHSTPHDTFPGFAGRVWEPLLDDDRTFHVGVELAEVLEGPGRVEFLR